MTRNTISRTMHDLGLAAWFGGTLANAIALNPAAGAAGDASSTGAVANIGWDRWTPVNAAAIGVHLVGSTGQLVGNMGRLRAQRGVATMAIAKTALTAAALAATSYSRAVGKKLQTAQTSRRRRALIPMRRPRPRPPRHNDSCRSSNGLFRRSLARSSS